MCLWLLNPYIAITLLIPVCVCVCLSIPLPSQVMAGQESLEKKLALVETHQKEIHDTLVSMEGEAERLYREERALLDDDSRCGEPKGGGGLLMLAGTWLGHCIVFC